MSLLTNVIEIGGLWHRQGPSYRDERTAELIFAKGTVYIACIEEFDSGYPYARGYHKCYIGVSNDTEYALVRIDRVDDTVDPPEHSTYYLLFVKEFGWWRFEGNDARKLETLAKIPSMNWEDMVIGRVYAG